MDFLFLGGLVILAIAGVLFFSKEKETKENTDNQENIKDIDIFLDFVKNTLVQKQENAEWITAEEISNMFFDYKDTYKELLNKENKSENESTFLTEFSKLFVKEPDFIPIEQAIININQKFIDLELNKNKELFDNIDGKSLDYQQRISAIIDDNKLIVAGAGSGKTLTVAGTVKYLISSKHVDPKDILLITYTKKAAKEMKERIVEKLNIDVDVYTFHALGSKILRETTKIKSNILEDPYNKKFYEFLKKHENFILKIMQYHFLYRNKVVENTKNIINKEKEVENYRAAIEKSNNANEALTDDEKRLINKMQKEMQKYKLNREEKALDYILFEKDIEKRYTRGDIKTLKDFFSKKYYKNKEEDLLNLLQKIKTEKTEKDPEYKKNLEILKKLDLEEKTLGHDKVKSNEEALIANFLFRNNIKYKYEHPYSVDTANYHYRQYKPDFYLPEYDIYIEHFGVNKDFKTPQYTPEEERIYLEGIKWKREIHKKYNTKMIESYSYEFSEENFPEALKEKLEKEGVVFNPIPKDKLASFVESMIEEIKAKDHAFKIFLTFINLFKSNDYDLSDFEQIKDTIYRERKNTNFDNYIYRKESTFLEIAMELYNIYEEFLKEEKSIDFSDMINKSIKNLDSYNKSYKYIIIDEYQDTSKIRCELITQLKEKNENCKIMVVGDDWQSIYRFSGNDLNLFINFDKYLGYGIRLNIENTYRNSKELVDIASNFIMKNENQIKKSLKSNISLHDFPIKSLKYKRERESEIRYDENGEYYEEKFNTDLRKSFYRIIKDIKHKNPKAKNIMILGRYKHDVKLLYEETNLEQVKKYNNKKQIIYPGSGLNFESHTIHSSKGLEADEVILLVNDSDFLGFPSRIQDDPIFRFVLSKKEDFPYAEERRLFYVATTRTRNRVYIIYNQEQISEFVKELQKEKNIFLLNRNPRKNKESQKHKSSIYFNKIRRRYEKINFIVDDDDYNSIFNE